MLQRLNGSLTSWRLATRVYGAHYELWILTSLVLENTLVYRLRGVQNSPFLDLQTK